jgi:hypothetical protein
MLPGVSWLAMNWDMHPKTDVAFENCDGGQDDGSPFSDDYYGRNCFFFEFTIDEAAKAGMSGGTHSMRLPSRLADPMIRGIDDGVLLNPTLVEYLRHAIAWGGRPGWAACPEGAPAALERLRTRPDF